MAETTCLPFSKAVVKRISVAGCSPPMRLDDDIDGWVGDDIMPVIVKASCSIPAASACSQASAQARSQHKVDAVGCQVLIVVALRSMGHAAADGSQTDQDRRSTVRRGSLIDNSFVHLMDG